MDEQQTISNAAAIELANILKSHMLKMINKATIALEITAITGDKIDTEQTLITKKMPIPSSKEDKSDEFEIPNSFLSIDSLGEDYNKKLFEKNLCKLLSEDFEARLSELGLVGLQVFLSTAIRFYYTVVIEPVFIIPSDLKKMLKVDRRVLEIISLSNALGLSIPKALKMRRREIPQIKKNKQKGADTWNRIKEAIEELKNEEIKKQDYSRRTLHEAVEEENGIKALMHAKAKAEKKSGDISKTTTVSTGHIYTLLNKRTDKKLTSRKGEKIKRFSYQELYEVTKDLS